MDHNWILYKDTGPGKFYKCTNCNLIHHTSENSSIFAQEYYYLDVHPLVNQFKDQKHYNKDTKCSEVIMENVME